MGMRLRVVRRWLAALAGPVRVCAVCGREGRALLGWVETPDGRRMYGCSMEHLNALAEVRS